MAIIFLNWDAGVAASAAIQAVPEMPLAPKTRAAPDIVYDW